MNNGPISSYPFARKIPEGDTHERHVCGDCGWINYVNPKIVVGAVCTWEDKILLCKRAIEPRHGYWTVPAGFMEEGESTAEGAIRETLEEACATIEVDALIGIYNIPRISQVHMMYRAKMLSPDMGAGIESLEVKLVTARPTVVAASSPQPEMAKAPTSALRPIKRFELREKTDRNMFSS